MMELQACTSISDMLFMSVSSLPACPCTTYAQYPQSSEVFDPLDLSFMWVRGTDPGSTLMQTVLFTADLKSGECHPVCLPHSC